MKRFAQAGLVAACIATPFPEPVFAAPVLVEVASVSADTLVLIIEQPSDELAPTKAATDYSVNAEPPSAVGRWSYVWQQGLPPANVMQMRHHVYLRLQEPLVEGASYTLSGSFGTKTITFSAETVRAESLMVNQAGYASSAASFAVFAPWAGDEGVIGVDHPPAFRVIDAEGTTLKTGTAVDRGLDLDGPIASGDHVHRIPLQDLPHGGPYRIVVDGVGSSWPFGIGATYAQSSAYTVTRGLYHQRCGLALEAAFTPFTRGVCHATVQVTDAEPPGFITATGPVRGISGGYHDAGDFDRRQSHTLIPAWMLTLFDAFPSELADAGFDLPESGNPVPDWLDEALWGVRVWEMLQEPTGGVRAGTEADRHPTYGEVSADTDALTYRTYRVDGHATASAVGLFAQAARLVEPYDPSRAAMLIQRAHLGWTFLETTTLPSARTAQRMYAALQLYLATGDAAYHDAFKSAVASLATAPWPQQYHPPYFSLDTAVSGQVFSPYFVSYLWTDRPTDPATRKILDDWLAADAGAVMAADLQQAYPVGNAPNAAWGSLSTQGRYADPLIYRFRIDRDPSTWNAIARLRDYALGLNPIGKSYITGLGANSPHTPLHLDSYFTQVRGLGSVPGITVFGPMHTPSNIGYQQIVWQKVYPAWSTLPPARRFSEGWSLVPVNEFGTAETMVQNAVMHAFVAHVPSGELFVSSFE